MHRSNATCSPRGAPRAANSNTGVPSATRSSGERDPKDASTTSNEATAGTEPNSPASRVPEPGADTASSPTTWSKSAPSQHDRHGHPVRRNRQPPPDESSDALTFSGLSS